MGVELRQTICQSQSGTGQQADVAVPATVRF